MAKDFKPTIAVDFDGVIHSYKSGWTDRTTIPDEPVVGALEWLAEMLQDDRFEIVIYSTRNRDLNGIHAMREWLKKWWKLRNPDVDVDLVESIPFPSTKPTAWLTIDDRAMCFRGIFPTPEAMLEFQTWQKAAVFKDGMDIEVYVDGTLRLRSIL